MTRYRTWTPLLLLLLCAGSAQAQNTAAFPTELPDEPATNTPAVAPEAAPAAAVVAPPQQPTNAPVYTTRNAQPRRVAPQPRLLGMQETHHWYGWQTLATDGASMALLVASGMAGFEGGPVLGLMGIGTYAFGGPAVHAAHGNWGRSGASLGMRLGLPVLGAILGAVAENCDSSRTTDGDSSDGVFLCGLNGAAVGGGLGVLAAVVLDSAALAHETVMEEPQVAPYVQIGKGGASLGMAGRF